MKTLSPLDNQYRVIFSRVSGPLETFKRKMKRLGVSSKNIQLMIHKAPVILKGGMTLEQAEIYARAVLEAGGAVSIQEHPKIDSREKQHEKVKIHPFEHFTMCPECGHKQFRDACCEKCGYHFHDVRTDG